MLQANSFTDYKNFIKYKSCKGNFVAFSLILADVKNTRPIYHKNLLRTVFLYIQRAVFHIYCEYHLGSAGTVYGKRTQHFSNS